jgi:hypothetical protein
MTAINGFLDELLIAKAFEEVRLVGYEELLSFHPPLLSNEVLERVSIAHSWSNQRLTYINNNLSTLADLQQHNYPERPPQISNHEGILELNKALLVMQIAIGEFEEAPTLELTFGPEGTV